MLPEAEARRRTVRTVPLRPVARAQPNLAKPALAGWQGMVDLVAAAALAVLAGLVAAVGPEGSLVRIALAGLVVFALPGYLLVEAVAPRGKPGAPPRAMRALAALALSPALVGLLALSTALVPGGFKPASIVAVVTLACVGLAALAAQRRVAAASRAPQAGSAGA